MALKLQRLDPDRRRRRLALLAALSDAKTQRDRAAQPRRAGSQQLREMLAFPRRRPDGVSRDRARCADQLE
jgi:hypothetical protein